jgi:hypothetical protein
MKNHTSATRTILMVMLLCLPLLLVSPAKAYGYADPGSGAFVYQMFYAAFLGATFYLRKFLNRFGRKRNKGEE